MKKNFIILLLISVNIFSQKVEDIITDRPDQTESAFNIPKGFLQVETGAAIEHAETITTQAGELTLQDHTYPSVLIRYGATDNFELRLGFEHHKTKASIESFDEMENSGFSPLLLGTKINIFHEKGLLPETALMLHISIPIGSNRNYQPNNIGTDFRFSMQHELSSRFTLSYNIGGEWSGYDPTAVAIYTLAVGASLIGNLSAYVESYGFMPQDLPPDHRLDGGLTYLFAKNIQADVSGGVGLSEISPDYFIGIGFSFRLPR